MKNEILRGAGCRQGGVAKLLWPQRSVAIYIPTRNIARASARDVSFYLLHTEGHFLKDHFRVKVL